MKLGIKTIFSQLDQPIYSAFPILIFCARPNSCCLLAAIFCSAPPLPTKFSAVLFQSVGRDGNGAEGGIETWVILLPLFQALADYVLRFYFIQVIFNSLAL